MGYYEILLDGMDDSLTVTDIVRGGAWIGAELSDGGFGIAMNTEGNTVERMYGSLIGLGAKTAAKAVLSWNFDEASEGMAVINAFYNRLDRIDELNCKIPYTVPCTEGFVTEGKKIALIGHLSFDIDVLKGAKEVYIIERKPKPGDYPDSACEYILPACDMVIITGSASVNKTMTRLLELSRNADTIVIGPTVPLCPELKALGIDRLSGMAVLDKDRMREWMLSTMGNPYPLGENFVL